MGATQRTQTGGVVTIFSRIGENVEKENRHHDGSSIGPGAVGASVGESVREYFKNGSWAGAAGAAGVVERDAVQDFYSPVARDSAAERAGAVDTMGAGGRAAGGVCAAAARSGVQLEGVEAVLQAWERE